MMFAACLGLMSLRPRVFFRRPASRVSSGNALSRAGLSVKVLKATILSATSHGPYLDCISPEATERLAITCTLLTFVLGLRTILYFRLCAQHNA